MLDTAIILAGGQGTRLRPITDNIPKPMIPIHGKPLIEHIVEDLERYNIRRVCMTVGYKSEKITGHFDAQAAQRKSEIKYLVEERPLGTGGAIKSALELMGRPKDTLVIHGDSLFSVDLAGMYKRHTGLRAVITVGTTEVPDVRAFGMIESEGGVITRYVEKPKLEKPLPGTISTGVYIVSDKVLKHMPSTPAFSFERDVLEKMVGDPGLCCHPLESFYTVNDMEQYRSVLERLAPHKDNY